MLRLSKVIEILLYLKIIVFIWLSFYYVNNNEIVLLENNITKNRKIVNSNKLILRLPIMESVYFIDINEKYKNSLIYVVYDKKHIEHNIKVDYMYKNLSDSSSINKIYNVNKSEKNEITQLNLIKSLNEVVSTYETDSLLSNKNNCIKEIELNLSNKFRNEGYELIFTNVVFN